MDMLAVAANMDSLAFRLQNMQPDATNQRWSAVLQAAATAANWKPWVSGSNLSKENIVTGRGIANSHHGGAYAAVVADISVNKKSGKITVTHLYARTGLRLRGQPRPDLQPDGREPDPGHEPCPLGGGHVQQEPGHEHRLGHLPDPPLRGLRRQSRTCSSSGLDQPSLGSGEPVTCPVIGAIANAFYDATGVRMHEAPLTSGRVRAQLRAAGVS